MRRAARFSLARVNPITRAAVSSAYLLVATFTSSIQLLTLWCICALAVVQGFTSITLRQLVRRIVPFALFGLGFVWMNLLFHRSGDPAAGLRAGAVLFVRALVFGSVSLLFVQQMDQQLLADSLIRFVRLPPRLVYSIVIAFRIGPILRQERTEINLALGLRGIPRTKRLRDRVAARITELAAVFVAAIRRANRIAIALEARGLDNSARTYMHPPRLQNADLVFAVLAAIVMAASLTLVAWESWGGGFV